MPAKMARFSPSAAVRGVSDYGSHPCRQPVLPECGKSAKSTPVLGSSGESRFNVVLAIRRAGELLAQLANKDVDDLDLRLVHAAIEVVQEHFLGQRRALAQREELQNLVLLAGKMHARAVDLDRLGVEVDDEIAGPDDGLGVALGAADDGVDACHQLVLVEWFGHVVVGAEAETLDLVLDAGEAGEDQDLSLIHI